jgi:DNA-directed RNA polymerase sigma subunit (sigma70/sigma32)
MATLVEIPFIDDAIVALPQQEHCVNNREVRDAAKYIYSKLNKTERVILKLLYRRHNGRVTFTSVGHKLGFKMNKVINIYEKAIHKLRNDEELTKLFREEYKDYTACRPLIDINYSAFN